MLCDFRKGSYRANLSQKGLLPTGQAAGRWHLHDAEPCHLGQVGGISAILGESASEWKETTAAISNISSRKDSQPFPPRGRPRSCGRSRPAAAPLPHGRLPRWQEAAAAPGPAEALPHAEGKALAHPPEHNAPSTPRPEHLQTGRIKRATDWPPSPWPIPGRAAGRAGPAAAPPALSPRWVTGSHSKMSGAAFHHRRSALLLHWCGQRE